MTGVTVDTLLGGRVRLAQPARGYRAAIDPVLLAAFVPARAGDSVLEAGTGAAAASLCLLARVPGVKVNGVEIDPQLVALAHANALANHAADRLAVIEGDILAFRTSLFDHAMANPPFQPHGSGTASPDARKRQADREAAPHALAGWISAMARRLVPRGTLSLVLPGGRLSESLTACREAGLGAITVLPVAARTGDAAGRVLIRGGKSARGSDRLLAPLVLHDADGRYTAEANAVLRSGAALDA
jgi:tRNA1(Val) A37 N6-methylase TrmN6